MSYFVSGSHPQNIYPMDQKLSALTDLPGVTSRSYFVVPVGTKAIYLDSAIV